MQIHVKQTHIQHYQNRKSNHKVSFLIIVQFSAKKKENKQIKSCTEKKDRVLFRSLAKDKNKNTETNTHIHFLLYFKQEPQYQCLFSPKKEFEERVVIIAAVCGCKSSEEGLSDYNFYYSDYY